ncbi:MAG: TlpA family protein disulfide reductase [Acidobacteria bacterium]|nr:TlpA family protein disulfide reductase [Acidobacteriota bacterium]
MSGTERFAASVKAVVIAGLALLCLSLGSCREDPAPGYVRLSGEAPEIDGAPAGRALLVVFWASWCPPCRSETPSLRALAERPPAALTVVVLSQDADLNTVRSFFGSEPPEAFHLRLDPGARVAHSFQVDELPAAVLVVEGRLAARFTGGQAWDSRAMRRLLERLVSSRPGRVGL